MLTKHTVEIDNIRISRLNYLFKLLKSGDFSMIDSISLMLMIY